MSQEHGTMQVAAGKRRKQSAFMQTPSQAGASKQAVSATH